MSQLAKDRKNERGVVLVLFVLASIVLFSVTGLCVDLGMAYVRRSTLSKAADAGALAGARHTQKGDLGLKKIVRKVAQANYGIAMDDDTEGGNYRVKIIRPGDDVVRIEVLGDTISPTFFTKMLGREDVRIRVASEATRYPLDMSLVLDLSYSLQRNNAFDDMQEAAQGFLQNFDDNTDQFGIVTYSTWAEERMPLRKDFTFTGTSIIDSLFAISDTNIAEGLRLAKAQHDTALPRQAALKVVVLFTDGRPTAFADNFWMDGATDTCAAEQTSGTSGAMGFARITGVGTGFFGSARGAAPGGTSGGAGVDSDGDGTPDCYAGVVACYISGNSYRGLFKQPTGEKIRQFRSNGTIQYTSNGSRSGSPKPRRLPDGSSVTGTNIRRLGAEAAEAWANEIRAAGYTIYTVGLGNPAAQYEGDKPDLDFLRRVANEKGIVSASQPQGELMFAPTPAQLSAAFTKLADRILTRLTR